MSERVVTDPPDTFDRRSRFLLVVDGDANHLFYTSMLLQRLEYNISTAKTAEEALELMSVALPTLIVTELSLPGMSGRDFLRRLRGDSRTAAVPVISVTENYTPEVARECSQKGFAACIRKPIQAEELYRSTQSAIEDKPRSAIRISTLLAVTVNSVPLNCAEGECISVLSEKGLFIRTLRPQPEKALVTVHFVIQGKGISAEAVVLYRHTAVQGAVKEPGMGLQFTRIATNSLDAIRRYIQDEITRGIRPL